MSGELMSEEHVKAYIAADEVAERRHFTPTVGAGTELELFPWYI